MLIFGAIAIAGLILLVGGALFGHDADHDFDHDHGGFDHGGDHGSEGMISIFSTRVVGTFIMGFGGGGVIGSYYGLAVVGASIAGIIVGVIMAAIMYLVLKVLYSHQSNSLVSSTTLVGKTGLVTTSIGENAVGEVQIFDGDDRFTRLASSTSGAGILKGRRVIVHEVVGSQLLVKEQISEDNS